MAAMFEFSGDDPLKAQRESSAVLAVETRLAEATLERVKMRDPKNRDHKMSLDDLTALAPAIPFARFFKATGAPAFTEVNVAPVEFFQKLNAALDSLPRDTWKTYLNWHLLQANPPSLSDPCVK